MKKTICLIGTGLIGGSMALKLRKRGFTNRIIGVDKSMENLETAKRLEIIDAYSDLEFAVKSSDLVILAVPVDVAKKMMPRILDLITDQQTVMDTGSTKAGVVGAADAHAMRSRFVASHPMWGTENSGPEAATVDSFRGRAAVICNREDSAEDAAELVQQVYENLEMKLLYMNAEAHDVHTAYISHISHITSYALANTVLEKEREEETIFQLASSGFSSTVRLAKSSPEMWVPIFKQNKENVLDVLNEHISQLRKFKSALEKENYEFLKELIVKANHIRSVLK